MNETFYTSLIAAVLATGGAAYAQTPPASNAVSAPATEQTKATPAKTVVIHNVKIHADKKNEKPAPSAKASEPPKN